MAETLKLPQRLDTQAAGDLLKVLKEHRGDDVILDASDVTHVGMLCTQAILSAARDLAANGKAMAINNGGEVFRAQLAAMGLDTDSLTEGRK